MITHAGARADTGLVACCNLAPIQLPAADRIVFDPSEVTCNGRTVPVPATPTPVTDALVERCADAGLAALPVAKRTLLGLADVRVLVRAALVAERTTS